MLLEDSIKWNRIFQFFIPSYQSLSLSNHQSLSISAYISLVLCICTFSSADEGPRIEMICAVVAHFYAMLN